MLAPPGTIETHPGRADITPNVSVIRWLSGARRAAPSISNMKSAAAMAASRR
jgi:hypothetical protein